MKNLLLLLLPILNACVVSPEIPDFQILPGSAYVKCYAGDKLLFTKVISESEQVAIVGGVIGIKDNYTQVIYYLTYNCHVGMNGSVLPNSMQQMDKNLLGE